MKKLFLFIAFLSISSLIFCQDLIIHSDGTEIDCFITRVDSSRVYFNVKSNGNVLKKSLAKGEIKDMKFGVKTARPQTELSDKTVPVEYKKKLIEGYITAGFTFSTFAGDGKVYADDLNLSMLAQSGVNFGFKRWPRLFPMNFGAGVGINLTTWFSINGGVEFVPKGVRYHGKAEFDGADYTIDLTYKVNYVEFPVSVKLSTRGFGNPDGLYGYIKGGFAPAYLVMSRYRYVVYGSNGYDSDTDSETDEFENTTDNDFCTFIAMGFGKGKATFLEVKYETGTKNVVDPEFWSYEFYNRSVSLNFILSF